MEYIDGEDLASLLRRIGRLPAGQGARHRAPDLRRASPPRTTAACCTAISSRPTSCSTAAAACASPTSASRSPPTRRARGGRVGHAGLHGARAARRRAARRSAATSTRSASCSTSSSPASARSPRASLDELRARKEQETPAAPSELIKDMDPAVERVILRAIARDPRARPASVAQVAAALPGGNPLEAALRAGETPSPEMVAASGTNEGLSRRVAWALLALVVAGAVAGDRRRVESAALATRRPGQIARGAGRERARHAGAARLRRRRRPIAHRGSRSISTTCDTSGRAIPRGRAGTSATRASCASGTARARSRSRAGAFLSSTGTSRASARSTRRSMWPAMALVRLDPSGRLTQLVVVPPSADEATANRAEAGLGGVPRPGRLRSVGVEAGRAANGTRRSTQTRAPRGKGRGRTGPTCRCGSRPRRSAAGPSTSKRSIPWTRPPRTAPAAAHGRRAQRAGADFPHPGGDDRRSRRLRAAERPRGTRRPPRRAPAVGDSSSRR